MTYYLTHGISQFLLNNEKQRVRFLLAHSVYSKTNITIQPSDNTKKPNQRKPARRCSASENHLFCTLQMHSLLLLLTCKTHCQHGKATISRSSAQITLYKLALTFTETTTDIKNWH